MLKYISILLVGFALLFYTGCGSGDAEGNSNAPDSTIYVFSSGFVLNADRNQTTANVTFRGDFSSPDIMVAISDINFSVAGCQVKQSVVDPSEFEIAAGQSKMTKVTVTFSETCDAIGNTETMFKKTVRSLVSQSTVTTHETLLVQSQAFSSSSVAGNSSSSSSSTAQTIPTVVIPNDLQTVELTASGQPVVMTINVFDSETKAPYTEGYVHVELPEKVLQGADVGTFESYKVALNQKGQAIFNYKGPDDLSTLVNSGDTGSEFKFFHEDNAEEKKTMNIIYNPENPYVPVNYELVFDGNKTLKLENVSTFTVTLLDDKGNTIDDALIDSIKVDVKNSLVGHLIDNGEIIYSIEKVNKNAFAVYVGTTTVSGLLPIEISAVVSDINNNKINLNDTFNLVALSGPPTALSISYAGVYQDVNASKYIERFAVSATDAYGNRINTQPFVSVGAIAGYAVDGSAPSAEETNETKRLFFGRYDEISGKIVQMGDNTAQFELSDGTDRFQYVDPYNDKMALMAEGYKYEALGKWDFNILNNDLLQLRDSYFGETRDDLFFAIGHSYRKDYCREDGREWIGTARSDTYQLDVDGTVIVEYVYDYYLTGKDIIVWVNLKGYQADTNSNTRVGEAVKHTLRGNGLYGSPKGGYTLQAGASATVTFYIHHENAPEWYRNGHFGYGVAGACSATEIEASNYYDARSCLYGGDGTAFVTLYVTNPSAKDPCTITLTGVNPAQEF